MRNLHRLNCIIDNCKYGINNHDGLIFNKIYATCPKCKRRMMPYLWLKYDRDNIRYGYYQQNFIISNEGLKKLLTFSLYPYPNETCSVIWLSALINII